MNCPNTFRIDGELTIYRAAELRDALKAALAGAHDATAFDLDLSDVTEIDSAGVQLLISARQTARARGCELRLGGRSPAVAEVFATLQLDGHFADVPHSPTATRNC